MKENKKLMIFFFVVLIKKNFPHKNYIDIVELIYKSNFNEIYNEYIIKNNLLEIISKTYFDFNELKLIFEDIINFNDYNYILSIANDNNIIKELLNNTKNIFLNVDSLEHIIFNTILNIEKLNYDNINVIGYNYFKPDNINNFFSKRISSSLIWRITNFINHNNSNIKQINVLNETYYIDNDVENKYFISYGNIMNYSHYINSSKIINISDNYFLFSLHNRFNIHERFFDLTIMNENQIKEYVSGLNIELFYKLKIKIYEEPKKYIDNSSEDTEIILLTDIFYLKERKELSYYKNILNLSEQPYCYEKSLNSFIEGIDKLNNNQNLFLIFTYIDFFEKIYNFDSSELKYFYHTFYFPDVEFEINTYFSFKQKIISFINEYYFNKYSYDHISYFIDLLFIYLLYNKNFEIENFKINIFIIENFKIFLDYSKNIDFDIRYNLKDLFNYIKNENDQIIKFEQELNPNMINAFTSFLNAYGYDRINKLFIFLEGYSSYISSVFISDKDIIKITKFNTFIEDLKEEDYYNYTSFGNWSDLLKEISENKILELTHLTSHKIKKIKEIISTFRNLRNNIKGHGCYFVEEQENIEKYFFNNIIFLNEINIAIKNIDKEKIKHFINYEEKELFLTFKTFYQKNKFNKIDFYNHSNPYQKEKININIGEYLYKLNVKQITNHFLSYLTKYYEKIISSNIVEYNFDFKIDKDNKLYISDIIVFSLPFNKVNDFDLLKQFLIKKNIEIYSNDGSILFLNDKNIELCEINNSFILIYTFKKDFSIFEENNKQKLLSEIKSITDIIELLT